MYTYFFKETDRNGYITTYSCHHPRWIRGIPKGQLMRLFRNCTGLDEFNNQAEVLIERYVAKGYKERKLRDIKLQVLALDRKELLKDKSKKDGDFGTVFLTNYSSHYKQFEQIVKKYWPILFRDTTGLLV